ncbi:MarR family winged helix-turn-helix transcriptional regulator [Microbacterium sp. TNHR37B]|uniref:MarR family winged helix-turn-helix transcriptional regulator n=1 Tax=Microbacterium sp. TNHR37B TaxID=1775956 RepID=UPI0007B18B06|nr:MarR family transcriptional regulator [Microbacterium sp. TNHR37B]KZE91167.1 putative HTH-type transcriptional regulator [Microbacterium sp. TNHR37B]
MNPADDLLRIVIGANALTRIASTETRNEAPAAQWRTLSLLRTHGPQRVGDLASLSRVTQPGMTRLVGQLAEEGLVARSSDPADSRAIVVSITDTGARALEGWLDLLRSSWEPRLAQLDDADRAALARTAALLERVAAPQGVAR